jgi:ABC-type lipoprotein export system ATPase subunit
MSMLLQSERKTILGELLSEKNHATVLMISCDPEIQKMCTRVITI